MAAVTETSDVSPTNWRRCSWRNWRKWWRLFITGWSIRIDMKNPWRCNGDIVNNAWQFPHFRTGQSLRWICHERMKINLHQITMTIGRNLLSLWKNVWQIWSFDEKHAFTKRRIRHWWRRWHSHCFHSCYYLFSLLLVFLLLSLIVLLLSYFLLFCKSKRKIGRRWNENALHSGRGAKM